VTVDAIAVAEEIGRRGLVRKGIDDLLGGPGASGRLGHVEVNDAPAMVSEHDENEKDAQTRGGDREEIEGDEISDMVGEERPPGWRRLGRTLGHEAADGTLGDVDAEPEKLAADAGRTPQGIGHGYLPDECGDLGVDGSASASGSV
jgi:hypothetical protein